VIRFRCIATIDFYYTVTADTEAEAEALLTEALGPEWEGNFNPDIEENPQIEGPTFDTDISCLGPEIEGEDEGSNAEASS
jgi:hypothetical protein